MDWLLSSRKSVQFHAGLALKQVGHSSSAKREPRASGMLKTGLGSGRQARFFDARADAHAARVVVSNGGGVPQVVGASQCVKCCRDVMMLATSGERVRPHDRGHNNKRSQQLEKSWCRVIMRKSLRLLLSCHCDPIVTVTRLAV